MVSQWKATPLLYRLHLEVDPHALTYGFQRMYMPKPVLCAPSCETQSASNSGDLHDRTRDSKMLHPTFISLYSRKTVHPLSFVGYISIRDPQCTNGIIITGQVSSSQHIPYNVLDPLINNAPKLTIPCKFKYQISVSCIMKCRVQRIVVIGVQPF